MFFLLLYLSQKIANFEEIVKLFAGFSEEKFRIYRISWLFLLLLWQLLKLFMEKSNMRCWEFFYPTFLLKLQISPIESSEFSQTIFNTQSTIQNFKPLFFFFAYLFVLTNRIKIENWANFSISFISFQ